MIQRKFGFEIETGIRTSAVNTSTAGSPPQESDYVPTPYGAVKNVPVLGRTGSFAAHLDHRRNEDDSIIEFVTNPPFDELAESKQSVQEKMEDMAMMATTIAQEVASGPRPLSRYFRTEEADNWQLYAGIPDAPAQSPYGYVQCTFGIKVKNIPQMYQDFVDTQKTNTLTDAYNISNAVQDAQKVMQAVSAYISAKRERQFFLPLKDKLEGFITLIIRNVYSLCYLAETGGLLKNQMGQLFNKTPLNDVRDNLFGTLKTSPEYEELLIHIYY